MNSIKANLERVAAIVSIVLAGILVMGVIVLWSEIGYYETISLILACIALFSIAMIVIASLLCPRPKIMEDGSINNRYGLAITLIVLLAILTILEFVGDGVVFGVLCLIPLGLEIASICMHHGETTNVDNKTTKSVSDKIREYKELKENNLIDEEQYKKAVDELLK